MAAVSLGPLEDFPPGEVCAVEVDGRLVGVVRTAGHVFVFGGRCPHQGGPICKGRMTGTMLPSKPDEYVYGHDSEIVRCPWHGYEFHVRTGESVGGAIKGRLAVFDAEVRDGLVYTSLRRVPPRPAIENEERA